MNKIKYLFAAALITFSFNMPVSLAQEIDSPLLIFNRGKLWQSIYLGKLGPSTFNNWRRVGIGLDWPGFDETLINEDIGGPATHMVAGGFWVGCRKSADSVLAVEDWSIYGSSVAVEATAKYKVQRHKKINNHWLQDNPNIGEEVIETIWEYNPGYQNEFDLDRQLPIRVKRTSHQWNGSKSDENYIIHEYVLTNISPEIRANYPTREISDTLYDFRMLLNYGLQTNSRSWRVLFPNLTAGARNTFLFYDSRNKMIYGRAGDFLDTKDKNEEWGWSPIMGPIINGKPNGEWLAPGFVGFRVLYASPNKNGVETEIAGFGWSAGDNSQDLIGPMTGKGTREVQYDVIADPSNANNFVSNPGDTTFMRRSRMWSMLSLGPWDILPGDSIKVVFAEFVDGVDYDQALSTASDAAAKISQTGSRKFFLTRDKAGFTYQNGYNHPDPPAAPQFTVDLAQGRNDLVANQISWGDEAELIRDPDDNLDDLAGYKIYRSNYLPIGPWDTVATVLRSDPKYYDPGLGKYTLIDSTVTIGARYYYALTAFDSGRTVWNINPNAIIPETNSNRVPPLESSIFANRTRTPFTATLASPNTLDEIIVVPNPFVIGEGFSIPGENDRILFVNLPNPCTLRIYSVRGDLVKTIEVYEGQGAIAEWDQVTDFGQFVESGIYIYHVDSKIGTKIGKLAIVR